MHNNPTHLRMCHSKFGIHGILAQSEPLTKIRKNIPAKRRHSSQVKASDHASVTATAVDTTRQNRCPSYTTAQQARLCSAKLVEQGSPAALCHMYPMWTNTSRLVHQH